METNAKAKYSGVLLTPRVTEKASFVSMSNVYTFEISDKATKSQVSGAVKAFYNVSPIKVNIVRNSGKSTFFRGYKGSTSGVKKAYVYLKEGDKIE